MRLLLMITFNWLAVNALTLDPENGLPFALGLTSALTLSWNNLWSRGWSICGWCMRHCMCPYITRLGWCRHTSLALLMTPITTTLPSITAFNTLMTPIIATLASMTWLTSESLAFSEAFRVPSIAYGM